MAAGFHYTEPVSNPVYCRCPDVRGDEILLTADDDVWLAPFAGGRAQRLTSDHARVANPRFSPDGTRVAWTSSVAGEPDAYLLDRATGAVRRLTWFGGNCTVVAWRDDGHVVVASGHEEVMSPLQRLSTCTRISAEVFDSAFTIAATILSLSSRDKSGEGISSRN